MSLLALAALAAVFTSGCAGPEQKLGRGMSNTFEIARMGEMRRTVEQTAMFESPGIGYTAGVIHGFDRSVARTALGVFEVATFPLPPYRSDFHADTSSPSRFSRKLQAGAVFRSRCLTPTPTWVSAAAKLRRSSPAAGSACSTIALVAEIHFAQRASTFSLARFALMNMGSKKNRPARSTCC